MALRTFCLVGRALLILLVLGGCRAAVPADRVRLEHLSIAPRASASRGNFFTSTNEDLVPLRDWLRRNVGGRAVLSADGPGLPLHGPLSWAFGGATEEFDAFPPPDGRHRPEPRALTIPVEFASLEGLTGELAVLSADPVLGAIFAPAAPPAMGCGGAGGGGSSALSAYISHAELTINPASTEVYWTVPPRPCPPAPPPTTEVPVLTIRSTFAANVIVSGDVEQLFDVQIHHVAVAVSITPTVCGTTLARPCPTSGRRIFEDYLSVLPDGSAGSPTDATYPDTHLELAVSASYVETPGDVFVAVDGRCPFVAGFIGAILGGLLGSLAGPYGVLAGLAIGAVVGATAAGIACGVLAVTEVTPGVRATIVQAVAPVGQLVDVMVNPPTLRFTLREALVSAADGLVDLDGDGVADVDATGARDRTAANGTPSLAEVNLLLAPTSLDVLAWTGLMGSWNFIPVSLEAEAALDPRAPAVLTPITAPDGAFLDAGIVAFAGASGLGPTPIEVRRATLDFGAVSPVCAPGGTRPGVAPPSLCLACPPSNCPGPMCPCPGPGCFCTGDDLSDIVDEFLVEPGTPLLELTMPASPGIATLLSAAPMMATAIRRVFGRPLGGPAAYYTSAVGREGSATFAFRDDMDRDLIDYSEDNCPTVFNPDQAADGDGDPFGRACDNCIGIRTLVDRLNADGDGDGAGYACDCDVDGDLCTNEGVRINSAGFVINCLPSLDGIFDPNPDFVGPDRNGDGASDDCDPDLDRDGVPNTEDNCPIGDEDDDLTEAIDRNPDQTDSGGGSDGDLCDELCPAPGGSLCELDTDSAPFAPIDTGFDLEGFIPAAGDCLFDGPGCNLLALGACFPNDPGCLGGFDQLVLVSSIGQQLTSFGTAKLGIDARFAPSVVALDDLDGDARDDFAVGAPRASACAPGVPKDQCISEAGIVLVIGSATETVLARLGTGEAGGRFGTALAFSGGVLAVGAPGATNAGGAQTGATFLYRVGSGGSVEALLPTFGRAAGDQFGSDVVAYPVDAGDEPQFLVGAPFADTTSLDAGQLTRLDGAAGVHLTYDGARARAALSRAVVVSGPSGAPIVVGGAPGWKGTPGSLYFFDGGTGRRRALVFGATGDGLGTTLVRVEDASGSGAVLAGAPGRSGGRGALDRYSLAARRTSTTLLPGAGLGTWLAAPGDLDGDGARDVVASVRIPDGRIVAVEILALSNTR